MILTAAAFLVQYVQMKRRTASAVPDSLNTVERWYVVKHEEMHIRHADPWMRAAGTIALCLHWWNPVVWYGIHTMLDSGEIVSAYPEAIADIGLKFSKKFEIAEPGFIVYTYNNATGEYMRVLYQWEETQRTYVKREEQKVDILSGMYRNRIGAA